MSNNNQISMARHNEEETFKLEMELNKCKMEIETLEKQKHIM